MRFALFYEIPVARPWTKTRELEAYKNTIEPMGKHVLPEFEG